MRNAAIPSRVHTCALFSFHSEPASEDHDEAQRARMYMQQDEQSDIVNRLRNAHDMQEGRGSGLYQEAADLIIQLRDHIDLLKANIGEMDQQARD